MVYFPLLAIADPQPVIFGLLIFIWIDQLSNWPYAFLLGVNTDITIFPLEIINGFFSHMLAPSTK